jgi:hypothetical protein
MKSRPDMAERQKRLCPTWHAEPEARLIGSRSEPGLPAYSGMLQRLAVNVTSISAFRSNDFVSTQPIQPLILPLDMQIIPALSLARGSSVGTVFPSST